MSCFKNFKLVATMGEFACYEVPAGEVIPYKENVKGWLSWSRGELNHVIQSEARGNPLTNNQTSWNKENKPVYLYVKGIPEPERNELGEISP